MLMGRSPSRNIFSSPSKLFAFCIVVPSSEVC
jgi:hypothetical protein